MPAETYALTALAAGVVLRSWAFSRSGISASSRTQLYGCPIDLTHHIIPKSEPGFSAALAGQARHNAPVASDHPIAVWKWDLPHVCPVACPVERPS